MTDQLSFLPMLDDAEHPTWLLNGKPGIQNDSGVYVENVFRFREGKEGRRTRTESSTGKNTENCIEKRLTPNRAKNATEEGKSKNSEYNARWREKNKEYDRERKREWWRRTHPNPKPIGRPRKNAKLGIADCRTQQTVRHHVPD